MSVGGTGSQRCSSRSVVGALIGTFIGFMVARIGVPSFVITLALFLGLQGVILVLLGNAGGLTALRSPAVLAIMNKSMPVWAGWVMLAVIIVVSRCSPGSTTVAEESRAGMPVRPIELALGTRRAWAVGGGLVVLMLSLNRSTSVIPIRGVPIVVPIALAVLWIGTTMLDRTRFGLHRMRLAATPRQPGGLASMSLGCDGCIHPLFQPRRGVGALHGQPGRHRRVLRRAETSCYPALPRQSSAASASLVVGVASLKRRSARCSSR